MHGKNLEIIPQLQLLIFFGSPVILQLHCDSKQHATQYTFIALTNYGILSNSIARISSKFATKSLSHFLLHLKQIVTLCCEI